MMLKLRVPEPVRAISNAAWTLVKSRGGITVILSGMAVTVSLWALERYFGDAAWEFLKRLFATIVPQLIAQPIGVGGLFLVFWLCSWGAIVLALGYRDARPKQSPVPIEQPKPPPVAVLTVAERQAIDPARVFWHRVGKDATAWAATGLEQLSYEVGNQTPLAWNLRPIAERLRESHSRVSNALHDFSQHPLPDVISRLAEMFRHYMSVVRWIHACEDWHGAQLKLEPHLNWYAQWASRHESFHSEFRDLSMRADYADLRSALKSSDADERFERADKK